MARVSCLSGDFLSSSISVQVFFGAEVVGFGGVAFMDIGSPTLLSSASFSFLPIRFSAKSSAHLSQVKLFVVSVRLRALP